jgi:hypothetical protein
VELDPAAVDEPVGVRLACAHGSACSAVQPSGQPPSGVGQVGPPDGHGQSEPAAGEQEQWGQGLLAGVVGQGVHGQWVWQ